MFTRIIRTFFSYVIYGILLDILLLGISATFFPSVVNSQYNAVRILYLKASCFYSRVTKGTHVTFNGSEIWLPRNWCINKQSVERLSLINGVHYFSGIPIISYIPMQSGPSLYIISEDSKKRDPFHAYRGKSCLSTESYYINSIQIDEIISRCNSEYDVFWTMPSVGLKIIDVAYSEKEFEHTLRSGRELISRIEPGKSWKNGLPDSRRTQGGQQ